MPHPMETRDDAELLRLYAETRSEEAFASFVQRYVDLVHSTAVRCAAGDTHLAKDITQGVFIILARRAASLVHHHAIEGWLYTTTRYEANHAVRREQRRRIREQKAQTMHELHSDATAEPDWRQLRPLIDDSMGQLSVPDREAVLMRFFMRRSFREISAKLGTNEDAARHRVDRALLKLQTLLARRGVTSTAAAVAGMLSTQAVVAAPAGMAGTVTGVAFASAGGAAATSLGLFHFMTTTKFAAGAACLALLAVVGTAVHEVNARGEIAASLAATTRQIDDSQRSLEDLRRHAQLTEDETAQLRHSLDEALASRGSATAATPAPTVARTDRQSLAMIAGDKFFAGHPEAKKLWDDRAKAGLTAKAAPLYRSLGLTAEQIAAFEELALQTQQRNTSFNSADGPIILHAEPTLTSEEFENRARALLGDSGWEQARDFGRLAPAYDLTAQLASAVYRSEPLSSTQIDQVARALANASASFRQGGTVNGGQINWNAALTDAQAVLSPGQLAALANLQPQTAFRQSVQNLANPGTRPSTPSASP